MNFDRGRGALGRMTRRELLDLISAFDEYAIVSSTDVRGDIIYVNDRFVEISGYSRDELLGRNHRVLESDEHPPELFREMWRTIAQRKTWHGESKNCKKGGPPLLGRCDHRSDLEFRG